MPRKAKAVIETKDVEDFKKEQKIFSFLHLFGSQHIVGTTPIEQIKYKTDYDLFEYTKFANKPQAYELVYQMFKEKYNEAHKNDKVWITDFKCGNHKSIPIRWDLQSINDGYKIIDEVNYKFTACLAQKSMIKMDVLALVNGILNEFSEVYFISFGKHNNYFSELNTKKELKVGIYNDALEYKEKGKFYKSLKRLFAYLRLDETLNAKKIKKILNWFNSPVGKLATLKSDLEELELLLTQKFRPVDDKVIKDQLEYIKKNVSDGFKPMIDNLIGISSHDKLVEGINEVMSEMNDVVQSATKEFIDKNKALYRLTRIKTVGGGAGAQTRRRQVPDAQPLITPSISYVNDEPYLERPYDFITAYTDPEGFRIFTEISNRAPTARMNNLIIRIRANDMISLNDYDYFIRKYDSNMFIGDGEDYHVNFPNSLDLLDLVSSPLAEATIVGSPVNVEAEVREDDNDREELRQADRIGGKKKKNKKFMKK